MTRQYISAMASLVAGASLLLLSSPARAFTFTTNLVPGSNKPVNDLWLESVELEDGTLINDFILVSDVSLISNTPYTGNNTGAASSDRGDKASGIQVEDPTGDNLATSLGNMNLNNIVDTEDRGAFTMNLFFEEAVDKLFFWERGMNSRLQVQALDATGNPFGNILTLNSATWDYAGFKIDTTEIDCLQKVGLLGVTLADFGINSPITGIQLVSKSSFNGPDFKVMGSSSESVPEPASLAGIALVAASLGFSRRRKGTPEA